MEKKHLLFNLEDPRGGLTNYAYDVVKLLLEDGEFFEKNIGLIDQNDFSDPEVRRVLGVMKDIYRNIHRHPSMETLRMFLEKDTSSDFDRQVDSEFLEMISERVLSENTREEIRNTVLYFNVFANICRVRNVANDGLTDGFKFTKIDCMYKLVDSILAAAENLRNSREQLEINRVNTVSRYEDEEF